MPVSSEQFIQWHDLFAVVDNGLVPPAQYELIEDAMLQQAKLFPAGISCLVILPPDAKPPPDDIKQAVKDVFVRLAPSISCLAYVIEGSGFKAVAARAALVSMKIFSSRPYPIYVETSMRDAIAKVLPHLAKGKTVTMDVKLIMKAIAEGRTQLAPLPSPPPPASPSIEIGGMTLK